MAVDGSNSPEVNMTTELKVTQAEIDERVRENSDVPYISCFDERDVRLELARETVQAAINELPGSRYKEILLFMLDEGLV
jgi:hypothetical protein